MDLPAIVRSQRRGQRGCQGKLYIVACEMVDYIAKMCSYNGYDCLYGCSVLIYIFQKSSDGWMELCNEGDAFFIGILVGITCQGFGSYDV